MLGLVGSFNFSIGKAPTLFETDGNVVDMRVCFRRPLGLFGTSLLLILEDSVVGVKAGVSAGVKVIGLTAGGHWHESRDEQELLEVGAFTVTDDYLKVQEIIESN